MLTTHQVRDIPLRPLSGRADPALSDETVKLIHEVLRTGIELAVLAGESTDADVVNYTARAARRLRATASDILRRESSNEAGTASLRKDLDRLNAMLKG